jgi:trk system potassium uptake protein
MESDVMKIIVIGCGRLGADLAYRLFKSGHDVAVIDNIALAFNNLSPSFQGRINEGDALSQDVLERSGIIDADAFAAVTNNDALNVVVANVAREIYHVPNIVVRNYDPRTRSLHEAFGFQVISSSSWGAQRMEEMIYHSDIRTIYSAGNGEVEIYEVSIPASWDGRPIQDLIACVDCKIVSISRAGRAMLPDDSIKLVSGDLVLVSATFGGVEGMRKRLNNQQEN